MRHLLLPSRLHRSPRTRLAMTTAATAGALIASLGMSSVFAAVTVSFVEPDKFVDIPFGIAEREDTLKKLREHFEKLGNQLPAGQDFKVDVLDVDLAGRTDPTRMPLSGDLRVLRGSSDWPMIRIRYAVESGGKAIKSGEVKLTELNYLQKYNRYNASESLRYEKAMIDEWFYAEIQPRKK